MTLKLMPFSLYITVNYYSFFVIIHICLDIFMPQKSHSLWVFLSSLSKSYPPFKDQLSNYILHEGFPQAPSPLWSLHLQVPAALIVFLPVLMHSTIF